MSLAELEALQALFSRAIVHPEGIDAFLAEADPATRAAFDAAFDGTAEFDARLRMGVYADAYFWRLHDVLLDHFSLVAWILGPAGFRNLATDYVLQRPSEDPDVRRFGARLPAFLGGHPLADR
ncbi:MAG: putative DNA-binding domain-containing protein, partial [Myxococcales bacterium]|nr:putative DNA-binding domain-containing protein [Myxococcales bacterium]